jgi:hypothetical protein
MRALSTLTQDSLSLIDPMVITITLYREATRVRRPVRSLERSCYVFCRNRIRYPWTVCFTSKFLFYFFHGI